MRIKGQIKKLWQQTEFTEEGEIYRNPAERKDPKKTTADKAENTT